MTGIKKTGFAIVLALAMVTASAASASAEEFIYSKTGKFSGKATNTQEFKTGTGATVECNEATPEGEVTKLNGTSLEITIKYSKCSVLAIGKATVSPVLLTLLIGPNLLSLLKEVTISASVAGVECEILVLSGQSLGSASGEIDYLNDGTSQIIVELKITKILSDIIKSNSSSLCGTAGEEKEGTYTGSLLIELLGGTIQV